MDQYKTENRFYARRMQGYLQDEVNSANERIFFKRKNHVMINSHWQNQKVKKIDGPGNTTLANQLDIENWTLINKTPDLPQQDNQTDCGVSLNIQKDPGGLSFSMNNVLGYQLMFFIGYIDCKARNRRNRMFGGPHELSHHPVVSCAAWKNFYYSPPLSRSTSSYEAHCLSQYHLCANACMMITDFVSTQICHLFLRFAEYFLPL